MRPGPGAGWPYDLHGADGGRNAVPLLPAQESFRTEFPRRASSRPLRRRTTHGLRHLDAGHDCRCDGRRVARADHIQTRRSRRCRPCRKDACGSCLIENSISLEERMTSVNTATQVDEGKLNAFIGQMLNDLGGASSIAMVRMGDALGLYKELHSKGPMTSAELAGSAKVDPRYLRERLSTHASSNYLPHDPASANFPLTPSPTMLF